MKTKTLQLILTAMFCVTSVGAQSLLMRHRDGTVTDIPLSAAPILETADGNIAVTTNDGSSTYDNNEVLAIMFQTPRSDVNRDYHTDISDVVSVINAMAGDNTYKDVSDVNGDNKTDISDVVAVINSIAGKKNDLSLPSFAPDQTSAIGDAFYIYRNDGEFNAFLRYEVENITFDNGNSLIQTADSIYAIPLAAIDSVSFVQPETVYAAGVVRMDSLIPHITSVDGMNFTIASNTPSNLIPHDGDVLLYENFENDMFPLGFAGCVSGVNNGVVSCDSVSFTDLYESYVCFGDYTLTDEDSESGIRRLKPKKISGNVSRELDLAAHIGYENFAVDIKGRQGVDVRVTMKYGKSSPLFFEMYIEPNTSLDISSFIKGELSKNFLDNKNLKLRLPIPDTPLLLGITGGPSVKFSLEASLSAAIHGNIGFRLGIKYVNDRFVPICKNISKGFSTPELEGSIDGSFFVGQQIEYGIYSYGDILSAVIEQEAGVELGANLTTDLLNSDNYEELSKGQIDLNLKASIGGKAELKIWKLVKLTRKLTLGSLDINLNSWRILPTFSRPAVNIGKNLQATVIVEPTEKLISPVGIGIGIFDEEGAITAKEYSPSDYRVPEKWGDGNFEHSFSGLTPKKSYEAAPIVRIFGKEIKASPVSSFCIDDIPVFISSFEMTKAQYKKGAFTHKDMLYDYRFDAATTVVCADMEGLSDWGYVYEDLDGEQARISLNAHGSPYTDTNYSYFRNTPVSYTRLYGYVKYEGDDNYYYGKPKDYVLKYEDPLFCPDSNHPHAIDLGIGVKWSCCNVGASAPWECGGYYAWGETEEKSRFSNDNYTYYKSGRCTDIGSDISGTRYDVAHVLWGDGWRMPNKSQMEALNSQCSSEWTEVLGVYGLKYTGPNGASIFIPAAGDKWRGTTYDVNTYGYYWTSTQLSDGLDYAHDLYFNKDNSYVDYASRTYGRSVRPVKE